MEDAACTPQVRRLRTEFPCSNPLLGRLFTAIKFENFGGGGGGCLQPLWTESPS